MKKKILLTNICLCTVITSYILIDSMRKPVQSQGDPVSYEELIYEPFEEDEIYWNGYAKQAKEVYLSIINHEEEKIIEFDTEEEALDFLYKFYYQYGLLASYQSAQGKRPSLLYYQQGKQYDEIYQGMEDLKRVEALTESVVEEGVSEFEAVNAIWHYIVKNYAYDEHVLGIGEMLDAKAGNCTPYATLFRQMCRCVGIDNNVMVGHAQSAYGWTLHAWNHVKIDGQWYYYDLTFYDTYALVGKDDFIHADSLWSSHQFESIQNGLCYKSSAYHE